MSTIERILLKRFPEYAGLNEEDKDDFFGDLDDAAKYEVNQEACTIDGIGEDKIVCTEPGRMPEGKTLLDYVNIMKWDKEDWEFQRESRLKLAEDCKDPEKRKKAVQEVFEDYEIYSLTLWGEWIRLIEKSRMIYGNLWSLSAYLQDLMDEWLTDWIRHAIPYDIEHQYVDSDDKSHGVCREVEFITKANGREKELDALQKKVWAYEKEKGLERIQNTLNQANLRGCTFRIDNFENSYDPCSEFILADEEVAQEITFEYFLRDFQRFQKPKSLIDPVVEDLKKAVRNDFLTIYRENATRNIP